MAKGVARPKRRRNELGAGRIVVAGKTRSELIGSLLQTAIEGRDDISMLWNAQPAVLDRRLQRLPLALAQQRQAQWRVVRQLDRRGGRVATAALKVGLVQRPTHAMQG